MYEDVVRSLRKMVKAHKEIYGGSTEESVAIEQAAYAIEELSKRVSKTPHGRLIESVELYGRAEDIKAKALSVYGKPQSWQFGVFWAIEQIEAALTNAPTIIRASKEGET